MSGNRHASTIHGAAVCYGDIGILLRGPSGSGKSDLAYRMIADGAALIADDRVIVERGAGGPELRAPEGLAGKIELRGVGIVTVANAPGAPLLAVADLVPAASVERLPEPARVEYEGVAVPRMAVAAFEESAVAKLRLFAYACAGRPDPVTGGRLADRETTPGGIAVWERGMRRRETQ